MYKDRVDLTFTFTKKEFTFIYLLKDNYLRIIYNHPAGLKL